MDIPTLTSNMKLDKGYNAIFSMLRKDLWTSKLINQVSDIFSLFVSVLTKSASTDSIQSMLPEDVVTRLLGGVSFGYGSFQV